MARDFSIYGISAKVDESIHNPDLRIQNALRAGKHSMETMVELNEVTLAFVEQVATYTL